MRIVWWACLAAAPLLYAEPHQSAVVPSAQPCIRGYTAFCTAEQGSLGKDGVLRTADVPLPRSAYCTRYYAASPAEPLARHAFVP